MERERSGDRRAVSPSGPTAAHGSDGARHGPPGGPWDAAGPLTPEQLAATARVDRSTVDLLADAGVLKPDPAGHVPSDVHRVRMWEMLHRAGITLDQFLSAIDAGIIYLEDLELVFPSPAPMSSATAASLGAEFGLESDAVRRIQLLLGLPARPSDDPLDEEEAASLRSLLSFGRFAGDMEAVVRLARLTGDSTQRLAMGVIGLFQEYVLRPQVEAGTRAHRSREDAERTGAFMRAGQASSLALLQRHVYLISTSNWAANVETLMTMKGLMDPRDGDIPGIAFVDLTGYTRLTEERGDEAGTSMAGRLLDMAEMTAASTGSRIVKLLGDGVMLHARRADAVLEAALALVRDLPTVGLPGAHAGVHAGPVIERDGDVFGRTVNLASRIAAQADEGEILVSEAMARIADDDVHLTEIPPRTLKGIVEPVSMYRAAPAGRSPAAKSQDV